MKDENDHINQAGRGVNVYLPADILAFWRWLTGNKSGAIADIIRRSPEFQAWKATRAK